MANDSIRRIYNSVDQLFDVWAMKQEVTYSRDVEVSRLPITAWQAFQLVRPAVRELDWQYQLKMITSQQGLTSNGTSAHWEFFFDLIRRRAEVVCEWVLPWDEALDNYGQARARLAATPFPAVNSPIRSAVREGKLLHQQMIAMWRQECERRPTLPTQFRDTDVALADFTRQGLDISQAEFSLYTGQSPQGRLSWIAQTRDTAYYSPFV
jgi:hypothetical protein